MKKIIFTALLLFLSFEAYSQGKIISKEEANKLFGPVLISKVFLTDGLQTTIDKSKEIVMFKIIDKEVYILNNNRDVLLPEKVKVDSSEVFSVYSLSVLQELMKNGGKDTTYVEQRDSVLTLTNGSLTVEYAKPCPPICN